MFAGHIGAALAIGRAQREVNVGVFVVAALLLDYLLWLFVLGLFVQDPNSKENSAALKGQGQDGQDQRE